MADLNIRSVRAKAYAVLRKSGVGVAKSHPSRIRGMKNWSRGVVLTERSGGARYPRGIYLVSYYDIRESREKDEARAIAALRAAGWTVTDDGRIEGVPESRARSRKED